VERAGVGTGPYRGAGNGSLDFILLRMTASKDGTSSLTVEDIGFGGDCKAWFSVV